MSVVRCHRHCSCRIDKPKALSLLLHTADISHPAKCWELHQRWTASLLEEFFKQVSGWARSAGPEDRRSFQSAGAGCFQGDKEAELGLPFSPLCDRKSTMVAQSQIGEHHSCRFSQLENFRISSRGSFH